MRALLLSTQGRGEWLLGAVLCLAFLACGRTGLVRPDATLGPGQGREDAGRDTWAPGDDGFSPDDRADAGYGSEVGGASIVGRLPSARHEMAVFSDGRVVYAAGGLDSRAGFLTEILRFDPATGQITLLPETLPNPTQAAGVGWTGEAAYLFGGRNASGFLTQIVRYQPSTGKVTLMKDQLPVGAYSLGVAWTGSLFYLFGGFTGVDSDQILSYDPVADVLTVSNQRMPAASQAPGVFWDGQGAWILGGANHGAGDAIQFFDPRTGEVTQVGRLPYVVWVPASFYDGATFYLAGGANNYSGYASILRFDPSAGQATRISTALPIRLGGRVATWVASAGCAYVMGGQDPPGGALLDTIIRVVP
jgi:hypothetical protein